MQGQIYRRPRWRLVLATSLAGLRAGLSASSSLSERVFPWAGTLATEWHSLSRHAKSGLPRIRRTCRYIARQFLPMDDCWHIRTREGPFCAKLVEKIPIHYGLRQTLN